MKFVKILVTLILLNVSGFAINIKYFSSVGIGHCNWKVKGTVINNTTKSTSEYEIKNNTWLQELQLGIILDKHHKAYFSYAHINSSNNSSSNLFGVNYDYLFNYNFYRSKLLLF